MSRSLVSSFAPVTTTDPQRFSLPTSWEEGPWAQSTPTTNEATEHTTFLPVHYESGYAYPLLVWLHEAGSSETELPHVMGHVSTRNHVGVAPRGAVRRSTEGYQWCQNDSGIAQAEQAVSEAIRSASDLFHVHPERVLIAGSGAGGTMAMRLAMLHPEWFAGAATLDGPLPQGKRPFCRLDAVRTLPFLLAQSSGAVGYTEPQLCDNLSLLHAAGCDVSVRQYQGEGNLRHAMLEDLDRWIMQLLLG